MTKLKHNNPYQTAAIIFAFVFCAVGANASTGLLWFSPTGILSIIYSPEAGSNGLQSNQQPFSNFNVEDALQIECPENISTYTDLNECTADISYSLNVTVTAGTLASLIWVMTGATENVSRSNGINQIDSYVFNEGTTTVTYTAKDKLNNMVVCTFTVIVSDNQVPKFVTLPENITVAADPGECGAHVTWPEPAVEDNCASPNQILKTSTHASGTFFPMGATKVTYIIDDGMAATQASYTFTVTVTDKTAPVLTAPEPITINCNEQIPPLYPSLQAFTSAGGTASDNCTPAPATFKFTGKTQSSAVCPYTLTRTYQIADTYGNIGKVEQLIFVGGPITEPAREEVVTLKSGMANYTATQSGPWSDPATWGNSGPPVSGDNVIIPVGITVTVNSAAACTNITINGSLTINGTNTLQVDGSITNSGTISGGSGIISVYGNWTNDGTFNAGTGNLNIYGNWANNGTFSAGTGTVAFRGSTPGNIISGVSPSAFYNIIIDKGTDTNTIIEANGTGALSNTGNLTISKGMFKMTSGTFQFTSNPNISNTAGFWLNGAILSCVTASSLGFSIDNNGWIKVSSGIFNVGTATGNSLITSGTTGKIEITGGTVNIAARLVNTNGTAIITGGTINLSTIGHSNATFASFQISADTKLEIKNDPQIIFQHPNTGTKGDIFIASGGSGAKLIEGGTFIMGNASTLATNNNFVINTPYALQNLTINSTNNPTVQLVGNNLSINNQLTMNGGNINTGTHTLILDGSSAASLSYSSGYINGTFKRQIANPGENYLLPVGNTSLQLNFDSINTPGYVTASSNGSLPAGFLLNSATTVGQVYITDKTIDFSSVSGNYVLPTNYSDNQRAAIFNNGSWSYTKPTGPNVAFNNWTTLTGSAFALADCIPPIITGTLEVCVGSTTQLTGSGTPDATTPWSSATPGVATVSQTGLVTGISGGTSEITYTDITGCQQTETVTVNPLPLTPAITGLTAVCVGSTIPLSTTATGTIVWNSSNPEAATINLATGVVTGVSAGTTNISYIVTSGVGCVSISSNYSVTVNPLPLTPPITGLTAVCVGSTITLSTTATGTVVWNSSNPAAATINSATGVVIGVSYGTTNISYTVTSGGCSSTSANYLVTVNTAPVITDQPTAPAAVCSGSGTQTISVTATGTGLTYQWQEFISSWTNISNGGDYSGATTATLTITNPPATMNGRKYRTVVTGTCAPPATSDGVATLSVNPIPSSSITGPVSVFAGSTYTYTSTPVPNDNVNHSWSITGNGTINGSTTSSTVSVDAGFAGTFTLTDNISRFGCTSSCTYLVTVVVPCSITPTPASVVNGTSTVYTAPAGMSTYNWSVTGNASIPSGINNQQTVTVLAGNSCTDYTLSLELTINESSTSCSQTVSVTDNLDPTFTQPTLAAGYCVENIYEAIFNETPTDPDIDDLTYPRPDYYIFEEGFTFLNLPAYSDNCALAVNSISWTIDFGNDGSVDLSGTGQLEDYVPPLLVFPDRPVSGIKFPLGTNRITYTVTDLAGNTSVQYVDLVVIPRPTIIKNF